MTMNTPDALRRPASTTAADISAGQWFWHEPCPGFRVQLQAVDVVLRANTVHITTSDGLREVVQYARTRPVSLVEDDRWTASLSGHRPVAEDFPAATAVG